MKRKEILDGLLSKRVSRKLTGFSITTGALFLSKIKS
jgi:hypothetical protein